MSSFAVRPATSADHPAIAEVHTACYPYLLTNAASLAQYAVAHAEEHFRVFVAEVDGRVVAAGAGRLDQMSPHAGAAHMELYVLPEFRRRGLGSALLERIEAHLSEIGGTRVRVSTIEEDGAAYAASHGFTPGRIGRISRCDLDALSGRLPVPSGVRLVRLSDVEDLRPVYEADTLTVRDLPGDSPIVPYTFDEWRTRILDDPRLSTEISTIVYADGEIAALAFLNHVGDRVYSAYTGTHPEHRGHGYATLVKSYALHAAAAMGVREAFTTNDAANAPMLAVNTRLGYVKYVDQLNHRREVG